MTLAEVRDWLETLELAEHCHIGRIENKKEKSLGVYGMARNGRPVMAIGGGALSSYDVRGVSLLLHWTRNAAAAETAAAALWDAVACVTDVDTPGGAHIQYIEPLVPEPVPVGTDDGGVYEYVVEMNIYYRR